MKRIFGESNRGIKTSWNISGEQVARIPMLPTSYIEREEQILKVFGTLIVTSKDDNGKN